MLIASCSALLIASCETPTLLTITSTLLIDLRSALLIGGSVPTTLLTKTSTLLIASSEAPTLLSVASALGILSILSSSRLVLLAFKSGVILAIFGGRYSLVRFDGLLASVCEGFINRLLTYSTPLIFNCLSWLISGITATSGISLLTLPNRLIVSDLCSLRSTAVFYTRICLCFFALSTALLTANNLLPYPIDSLLRHFGSFLFNRLNILII